MLHVGCGGEHLPGWFGECDEVRLDIDAMHAPDIVASMTDMGDIGGFDVVYSSHSLEHLYPHDVNRALREFARVLKPGGRAVILVPDLEDVRPTTDVVYVSPSGPICGLDMYYGHGRLVEAMPYMAHHCGFTSATLREALEGAGFVSITMTRLPQHNLMATGATS